VQYLVEILVFYIYHLLLCSNCAKILLFSTIKPREHMLVAPTHHIYNTKAVWFQYVTLPIKGTYLISRSINHIFERKTFHCIVRATTTVVWYRFRFSRKKKEVGILLTYFNLCKGDKNQKSIVCTSPMNFPVKPYEIWYFLLLNIREISIWRRVWCLR
jgi:hypothetical protein